MGISPAIANKMHARELKRKGQGGRRLQTALRSLDGGRWRPPGLDAGCKVRAGSAGSPWAGGCSVRACASEATPRVGVAGSPKGGGRSHAASDVRRESDGGCVRDSRYVTGPRELMSPRRPAPSEPGKATPPSPRVTAWRANSWARLCSGGAGSGRCFRSAASWMPVATPPSCPRVTARRANRRALSVLQRRGLPAPRDHALFFTSEGAAGQ